MKGLRLLVVVGLIVAMARAAGAALEQPPIHKDLNQGELRVQREDGSIVSCPLKHTDVKADISGFIARVKVRQTFYNPLKEKIEAVYVFPLPHEAAVDDMSMVIGDRRIVGMIKRRAAAREIYERALRHGQTAALLEQEQPNIFTQSVGNIKPKQTVVIEISYVDVLKYDMGVYEFHFPMVVGPRFIPGNAKGPKPELPQELQGMAVGPGPDTDRVPSASKINPPVLKPGMRNGHDISLSVELNAGVPVQKMEVVQHDAVVNRPGKSKASVKLDPKDSIPNRDFVLRYAVVGKKPEMAVLAHNAAGRSGTFMLMMQPKEDEKLRKQPPRELFFLVDVSGSMRGAPMAQVRKMMSQLIALCRPKDTVQIVTFAGSAHQMFDKPKTADDKTLQAALAKIENFRGGGGTYMMKGVRKCLEAPADPKRVRIVLMLTDGYIGNINEIIGEVGRKCGDRIRFWALGVGSSVNRALIDGVAKQGGGMGKVLTLREETQALSQQIMYRIQRAQLANIKIDWGGLDVFEQYPAKVPELWAGRPVILFARYRNGGKATVKINGKVEGEPASYPVAVELPRREKDHVVLPKVWARKKIEHLMLQNAIEHSDQVVEMVTQIALDYRLMSQYTSFVAVDEKDKDKTEVAMAPPRRMLVPVPLPEGVSFEGVFGPNPDEAVIGWDGGGWGRPGGPMILREAAAAEKELKKVDALAMKRPSRPMLHAAPPAPMATGVPAKSRQQFAQNGAAMPPMSAPAGSYRRGRALANRAKSGPSYGLGGRKAEMREMARLAPDTGMAAVKDAEAGGYAYDRDGMYAVNNALAQDIRKHAKLASKALAEGKKLAKDGKTDAARARFQQAYLLDAAAMRVRASNGQTAGDALAEIAKLEPKADWLDATLGRNVMVRNELLKEALERIAEAKGFKLTLGGLDDAKKLLGRDELRVDYLDLSHATVRQALDWLLRPMRLGWTVEGRTVVVGTPRQFGGPWVYDVSLMALPGKQAFEKKNWQQRHKIAAESASDFLAAIKTAAPQSVWYAPGKVLVFGTPNEHKAVAALLEKLRDPKAKLEGAAAKVHDAAAKRYAARRKAHDARLELADKLRTLQRMDDYGWALLAAAVDGRTDLEALTQLQIAWSDPFATKMVEDGSFTAVRTIWLLSESARLQPKSAELNKLAGSVVQANSKVLSEALADEAAGKDATACVKALYAALAARAVGLELPAPAKKGLAGLMAVVDGKDLVASYRTLARALLTDNADANAIRSLVANGRLGGDDLVVLGALAARKVGGDTWLHFRAKQPELLGGQSLNGSVIVLVNRLASAEPTVLAMK
jgi:Ca-activated chloride channel family protein